MLDTMELLPNKEKQRRDAVRTEPILLDGIGQAYWNLDGHCNGSKVMLQDFASWEVVTNMDTWFVFSADEEKVIERHVSCIRNQRRNKMNRVKVVPHTIKLLNGLSGDLVLLHKGKSGNEQNGREYTGRIASYEQRVQAAKKAEKLQSGLDSGHPSFVKMMVRSHVSSGFWLGLPANFCKDYLPLIEQRIILEDEAGLEFHAIYIGRRAGLSGGWRGFAMQHNLEDGDALVFELTDPQRFKVYIVKAFEDEARSMDVHAKQTAVEAVKGCAAAQKTTKVGAAKGAKKQGKHPR